MSVPASLFVNVIPGVLGAGGTAVDLIAVVLTRNTRVPIGTVPSFSSYAAVAAYFGAGSTEASIAQTYFQGPDNSLAKPGAILFYQYTGAGAVAAYIRGGNVSSLTIAQLQALSGTITITIDGVTVTSSAINLAAATSFSNAATLIATALAGADGSFTGSIAPGTATLSAGAIAGTTLTATVSAGALFPGQVLSGGGVAANTTIVSQLTGTAGSSGTYVVSVSQTVASGITGAAAAASGILTVTGTPTGVLAVGSTITGSTTAANTVVTGLITGAGAAGTYVVSGSQTVTSGTLVNSAWTVAYDSVSGGFVIASTFLSASSSVAYPTTNSLTTGLGLTAATSATLSQGAAQMTPTTAMNGIYAITTNWASYMTAFNPVTGDKILFAQWLNTYPNRFAYVMWDTDVTVTTTVPATQSAGYAIIQANISGCIPLWEPSDESIAAAVCGYAASLNFTAQGGRTDLAYTTQSGLVPGVTGGQSYSNITANGYSCYVSSSSGATTENFFAQGFCTGPFAWADSYYNQIWMNNLFQITLLSFLVSVKSVPYNAQGYGMLAQALSPAIQQAINFGAIRTGVKLSATEAAEVVALTGVQGAPAAVQVNGWYLFIGDPGATVRGQRGPPTMIFLYTDGQSIQQITLASLEII
jgi:hypothetical protein